jgi:hypothetical protein
LLAKIKVLFLTILNWEKWNPRKDLKSTSWFRFQNSIFDDPQFFEFDHSELLFFIYLLSLASKKQSGDIEVHVAHAQRIGRFETSTINSAIKKLIEINCVRTRDVDVTSIPADVPLRTNERNEHNVTNEHNTHTTNDTNADGESGDGLGDVELSKKVIQQHLDQIYSKYPRKLGKAGGMAVLGKAIITQADVDALSKAMTNFVKDVELNETPEGFVPYFSTWVGPFDKQAWPDYVDFIPKDRRPRGTPQDRKGTR